VSATEFAHPPGDDRSFAAFVDALPDVLAARDLRAVVDAIVSAAQRRRGVVLMLGGHVVKTGLAPLLIDLLERRVVTHIAMNGSGAIHDYEVARFGATSEDVAAGLRDGTFGMADETGREMNGAFVDGMRAGQGMGEALARALDARADLANPKLSILLNAFRLGTTVSVHAALGAEFIHQHPAANGAAIGDTSHRDFRRLAASLSDIDDGGVVLNIGSAVIMPEVFLKALTIARNLNAGGRRICVGRPRYAATLSTDDERGAAAHAAQRQGTRSPGTTRSWCRCWCGLWWTLCVGVDSYRQRRTRPM
jgi:hypothetical protein